MHARLFRRTCYGFTLLELIVTIVVLGVLAALAVPAFSAVIDRSKDEVLTAELEALGRGISALAAFDGELTDATVAEFVEAEASAGTQIAASTRWTVLTGAPASEPVPGEVYVAHQGGFLGAATVVPHDPTRVAYLLVGAAGGHAELPAGTAVTGGDALCFYGIDAGTNTGCTDQTEGAAASSVGGAVGTGGDSSAEASGPTVLASDTFDRTGAFAGSTVSGGTQTWAQWYGTTTTAETTGAVLQLPEPASGDPMEGYAVATGATDIDLSLGIVADGPYQAIAARVDGATGFVFGYGFGGSWYFEFADANAPWDMLASGTRAPAPTKLRLHVSGDTFTGYFDDDTSHAFQVVHTRNAASDSHGVWIRSAVGDVPQVDNFTATAP